MPSVYLDQLHWIALSTARLGLKRGEPFREAWDVALATREIGYATFLLSAGHYVETWRAADPERRARLATTMMQLSRGDTIARPPDLCDSELDAHIASELGQPRAAPAYPVFGFGFPHASGEGPSLTGESVDLRVERQHLAERPPGFDAHGHGHRVFGDMYRDGEMGLVRGNESRKEHKRVLAVGAVMEIHENIEAALTRAYARWCSDGRARVHRVCPAGSPERACRPGSSAALPFARDFVAALPTRDAALQLRMRRHRNRNNVWESNDMIDIAYLASAVVHCDIVVPEKQWVHELKQTGLLEHHSTQAISDVRELPDLLVSVTRATWRPCSSGCSRTPTTNARNTSSRRSAHRGRRIPPPKE